MNNGFGSYCYDLDCPGFVQIEKSYALGAVLRTSSFGGEQQTMDMKIFMDDVTGVWWLRVQDALLGYWPAELSLICSVAPTHTHYVVDPEELVQIVSMPACYSLGLHVQHGTPDKGGYFFYGGPGFSAECP
ncbi:hypothetical protein Ancab_012323 [Ancistrocladus abbreviatus]